MANKMLIDATHPEETRVVVLRGNRVEEFDFETAHRKQLRGNIYLAKVTRVEPSLQAAFVDYGGNRHGFLAFSEIHPDYYQIPVADRQALIDDDARAARESEAEDDHPRGRNRRRPRRGGRAHARADETIQSDPLAAEEPAAGAAGITAGDNATDAPQPDRDIESGSAEADSFEPRSAGPETSQFEPTTPEPDESAASEAAPGTEPAPQPVAETEHPPVNADVESPVAAHWSETEPAAGPAEVEPVAAESSADVHAPAEDDTAHDADGNGRGGNGADEEEEVVESVGGADAMEEVPDRAPRARRQYKIQEVIKRRQVMLVQVVKEERGTKGAALTTYLSLAGRYCVLMPNTARGGGISRKITSPEDRKKLREIAEELQVPDGMGVILRTAGANRTKAEVKRDFEYLLRLWEQVRDLTLKSTAPTLVYEEGSLAKRSIRDLYSKDIDEIVVAGEQGYKDSKEFMRMLMPSHAKNVKLYKDAQPIFTRFGIESQLDAMFSPTVQLRSGGYVVINQAEALVAIDVNSGRSTREHHIEDTALKTNVEAAEEVARQLRLRDLAGLIVIDFIDMDEKRNNRTVERRLKDALRNDRARIQVGRISHFGLLEMSRQRIRTSVLESSTEKCPHCGGTGHVRSVSSVALQLLRSIEELLLKGATHNLIVRTRPEIALYVLNHKRAHLAALEQRFRISITVNADAQVVGQAGFTVDRGEQVMTLDQAKALLAQSEAAPAIVEEEEEEPEPAEAAAEEDEAETEDAAPSEEVGATADEAAHEAENGRDGGRRRRRRRRGRGRGGEANESGGFEAERFTHDTVAEHGVVHAEDHLPPGEAEASPSGFAPAAEGHAEAEAEAHEGNGNGERRRRRRGRRGGRRSRRERDGHEQHDAAGAAGQDWSEAPRAEAGPADRREWGEQPPPPADIPEPPAYRPERHAEAVMPQPFETPAAVEAPALPAAEPPRRRSTVREPAPALGESAPVVTPMPSPQPAAPPPMVVTSNADSEDANKPRRTGWWSRRMLGGDKG
jgi:ribonuclease E